MKQGQFSYESGRSQSHASLTRYRRNTNEDSNFENRDTISSRPNVKMFAINNDCKNNQKMIKKIAVQKSPQELIKQNKLLEYQLKKRISENSVLGKFLKTKNSSQLSHVDIFLLVNQIQEQLQQSEQKRLKQQNRVQQLKQQLIQVQHEKQCHESQHLAQIKEASISVSKISQKNAEKIKELQKKLQTSQKELQNQKKRKQQLRILLDEVRKKYQLSKQNYDSIVKQLEQTKTQLQSIKMQVNQRDLRIKQIQRQLETEKDCLQRQSNIQKHRFEQQNQKLTDQIQNYRDQIQKMKLRQKQQQLVLDQMKSYYQQLRKKQSENVEALSSKVSQQDIKLTQTIQSWNQSSISLEESKKKSSLLQKENQKLKRQFQKQIASLKDGHKNQISQLHIKYTEQQGKLNLLQFELADKKSMLHNLQEKSSYEQKKHEQFEQQLYLTRKKLDTSAIRIRDLQKKQVENCQKIKAHNRTIRNEIQNYKAIGRVTQLIHQMKSLVNYDIAYNKQKEDQQEDNICACISNLADLQQLFIKNEYNPTIQENKQQKQQIELLNSHIKMLIIAYNNYVQDQELNGHANELYGSQQSPFYSRDKDCSRYLQLIVQRLIAMTAIKSYASDQGLASNTNQHQYTSFRSKSKDRASSNSNRYRQRDSLDSTLLSRRQQLENKVMQFENRNMSRNKGNIQRRQQQKGGINKLIRAKLQTEPAQLYSDERPKKRQQHIRRLYRQQYVKTEKQNLQDRYNRRQNTLQNRQNTLQNNIKYPQIDSIGSKYFSSGDRYSKQQIGQLQKQDNKIRQQFRNDKVVSKTMNEQPLRKSLKRTDNPVTQAIEKKYFR